MSYNKLKIKENLTKFDYKFLEKNNQIIVDLKLGLKVIIEINEMKYSITPKLMDWNLLTGAIEMKLKNSLIYNLIGSIILFLLCFIIPVS